MEDRRTLAAFLAIGVILLVLPYYYEWLGLGGQHAVSPEAADRAVERDTEAASTGSGPPGEAGSNASQREALRGALAPMEAHPFAERKIIVETPLQRLSFSTRGGTLTGCELLEYARVDGSPVELLPTGGRGLLVGLKQGTDATAGLENVEFVPSADRLEVQRGQEAVLRLRANLGSGAVVDKTLRFSGDRYGFWLTVDCSGLEPDTEIVLGWDGAVAITEEEASADLREARLLAMLGGSVTKLRASGTDREKEWEERGAVQWVGARGKYFLIALAPGGESARTTVRLRAAGRGKGVLPAYAFELRGRPSGTGRWESLVYLGPLEYRGLAGYGAELERAIDFGWPVVRQISWLLLVVFRWTYRLVPNYGWIIVLFGVAIKIVLYPLTHKTYESSARMQELQPELEVLREKYANDQQRLSKETMRLYRDKGVNPLGGCLPMLLQMPVFFALYNLLGRTIELRQAPFVLWIRDLSVPDSLMVAGVEIHVLPILMGASMLVQQKMTMKDPKQAMLVYLMPAMMVFIFWSMSSGLVLYWSVFNVLSIAQQAAVSRLGPAYVGQERRRGR